MITLYVIPLFFYLFKENIWLFSTYAPDHFLIGRRTPKSSSLPVMGFFLTWAGSCLGCAVTFHIWRLVGKKFFDKYKTQGGRFEKANKWVSKMKPGVVFTLLLMPFTPSSFVNFVVGLSDFEGVSYMAIMMTAKFGMLMSLALFGDSLVDVGKHPARAVLVAVFMIGLYFASKKLTKKMEEEEEKRILKKEEENNGFR